MQNWSLRRQYGEVYVLSFSDGLEIPCRALSYGEFLHYNELLEEGRVPPVILEDEIFVKTVMSPHLVDRLDFLKAGLVSLVAQTVMAASGPGPVDDFNEKLAQARNRIRNPVHELVLVIIRAFPSYKPEDIYSMSYDDMMTRLAQAEYLLMKAGLLQEEISLFVPDQPKKKGLSNPPRDLAAAWERQKEVSEKNATSNAGTRKKDPAGKQMPTPPKVSREDLYAKRGSIDFEAENREMVAAGGMSGHEMQDEALIKHKALKNMEKIYPHLFKKQDG